LLRSSLLVVATLAAGSSAQAAPVSYTFAGTLSYALSTTLPIGTAFTGTFSYDQSVIGTTTSFYGGTQTLFSNALSALTMTIGVETVTQTILPGTMALYNGVNPPGGIPVGDSLYTFNPLSGTLPPASTGSFAGFTPNAIYLGFVDPNGTAFTGTSTSVSLPASLSLSSFNVVAPFIGVNFGGPGPGYTSTVSTLTSLTSDWMMMLAGLGLMGVIVRRRKQVKI
jgi:hypothetical protein